jgi:predicted acyl esterase
MRTSRRLVALIVAMLAVAAIVGPAAGAEITAGPRDFIAAASTLSQPVYTKTITESTRVTMHDGETLYVEITRPDPAAYPDERFPVIMEASPYHGANGSRIGDRIFPDPVDASGKKIGLTGYFAPRGYAVVMVDLRGTGRSTGCLDHLGPNDAKDLKTVIEWAADRPWSTGKVGMAGHSYVGATQIVALAQKPRGLATIVPSAGLASMYDHQFQMGVPYNLQWIGPMVAYEWLAIARDLPPGVPSPPVLGGTTGDNFGNAPNAQFGCGLQNSAAISGTGQLTGQYELWHAKRDWRALAADADIPVFMVHGTNDNAARIPAAEWFFTQRFNRPGDKVWLGQWDHGSTISKCANAKGVQVTHPNCRFDQWQYALHAWFDKQLKGMDVDTGPAVEVFLNGETPRNVDSAIDPEKVGAKVYTADAWSRPAVRRDLYLDAATSSVQFQAPTAPGTKTFAVGANAGLASAGSGSATFTSAPLTEDTLFLGKPQLDLNASVSTGEIVHLIMTLYRQDAAGRREPMNTCAIQPQLRYGVSTIAPVVPTQEMDLPMQCFTMAHWVPAGQKLVAVVSTTDDHHATFGMADAQISVLTGPNRSRYTLPVVPGATLANDVPVRRR